MDDIIFMYVNILGYVLICKNRYLMFREKNFGNIEFCFFDVLGFIYFV